MPSSDKRHASAGFRVARCDKKAVQKSLSASLAIKPTSEGGQNDLPPIDDHLLR
jgi:hypothetical protein